jgi:hypothetical protein
MTVTDQERERIRGTLAKSFCRPSDLAQRLTESVAAPVTHSRRDGIHGWKNLALGLGQVRMLLGPYRRLIVTSKRCEVTEPHNVQA